MDVNISEKTEKPFNGIRFSTEDINKKVKAGAEKSIFETIEKMIELENNTNLNQESIENSSK